MFLKTLVASIRKLWIDTRARDDEAHDRIIVERLLEMSKRPPISAAATAEHYAERNKA